MSLTRLKTFVKCCSFFLIKAKSHRPIGLAYAAVRSDSVTLIQIIGRLSRLWLPCVCHTLSTPFACISHFFAGYSALKVPRIIIWYVLSFIFYHKFLKKSSLYVLTSCEITKIQKFTHNSFLFTHFRYLSALPLCENAPAFTNHTKLPTLVIFVKRSGSLFENHSPRRLVRFLVVCRIRLVQVIDAVNKFF